MRKSRPVYMPSGGIVFLCSIIIVLGFMWGQNTITVYGATVTTPDGYTVERRGGYGPAEVSLKSYSGTDSELTLPTKANFNGRDYNVEKIKKFLNKDQRECVTAITIPEGYKSIDLEAFKDCTALETIKIPASMEMIGAQAFEGCTALKNIEFASGSKKLILRNGVFAKCTALERVKLPGRINTDEDGTNYFYGCKSLKDISVEDNASYISAEGILYLKTPEGLMLVTYPGGKAGKEISLPAKIGEDSIVTLGAHSMRNLTAVNKIVLPDTVKTFKRYCINGCADLKRIVIKSKIIEIGEYTSAFAGMAPDSVIEVATEELKTFMEGKSDAYTSSNTTIEVGGAQANPGDMNEDGKLDLLDIIWIQKHYGITDQDVEWTNVAKADLNKDKRIDIEDLILVYKKVYEESEGGQG